ncbi:hypothetical protein LCGC14_2294200 [marine sediment metagenome]|uniref:Uncharacterized protein n=1 Tax=marine sediment metagenome TaxID=412755 RepID=A0A0F9DCX5_9ZZZZ
MIKVKYFLSSDMEKVHFCHNSQKYRFFQRKNYFFFKFKSHKIRYVRRNNAGNFFDLSVNVDNWIFCSHFYIQESI